MIDFDFEKTLSFVSRKKFDDSKSNIQKAKVQLVEGSGEGSEYVGWVDLPVTYDKDEFLKIKKAAGKIQSDSDVLVVLGIGGSYLGAKAALDFLNGGSYNLFKAAGIDESRLPEIYFVGNSLSAKEISDVLKFLEGRDYSINVISKSGTTMETALAFRIFRAEIEKKYGKEEAAKRIYVTTDKAKGVLRGLSEKEGYETFVVPDCVGGRFSVLTAVGLLPIAAAGRDIDALMDGAAEMRKHLIASSVSEEYRYAWLRQALFSSGKEIEIFAAFDPDLKMFMEWLKQLFGESEGKDGKGVFPASVCYTTDLHSMGQLVQDGKRNIFETIINVKEPWTDVEIPAFDEDFDGFKYLEGKGISIFNDVAVKGTGMAHFDGGVPVINIELEKRDEKNLGEAFYLFEYVCGISAYLEGVNPFNQPGVESYKKNIRALLAEYK